MIEHLIIGFFLGGIVYHHYLVARSELPKRLKRLFKTKTVRTQIQRNNKNRIRVRTSSN